MQSHIHDSEHTWSNTGFNNTKTVNDSCVNVQRKCIRNQPLHNVRIDVTSLTIFLLSTLEVSRMFLEISWAALNDVLISPVQNVSAFADVTCKGDFVNENCLALTCSFSPLKLTRKHHVFGRTQMTFVYIYRSVRLRVVTANVTRVPDDLCPLRNTIY